MTIDIKNLAQPAVQGMGDGRAPESRPTNAGGRNPQAAAPGPQASDTVVLTDAVRKMAELESTLAQTPAVDTGRIAALKQAIEDGSYDIRPERIAEKLIALENEF